MNMKKLLLLIIVCVVSLTVQAQKEHMKFKGIPMEGTLNSFVQKLKAKGYTFIRQEDGTAILKGEFATVKGCAIVVNRFSDRDQVNMVAVLFPEEKTWNAITTNYFVLKDMLTEKYGKPDCVEEFTERDPQDDFLRFHAILNDECNYISEFSSENGKIQLSMKKTSTLAASVFLRYIDNENADETRKKMMDDL